MLGSCLGSLATLQPMPAHVQRSRGYFYPINDTVRSTSGLQCSYYTEMSLSKSARKCQKYSISASIPPPTFASGQFPFPLSVRASWASEFMGFVFDSSSRPNTRMFCAWFCVFRICVALWRNKWRWWWRWWWWWWWWLVRFEIVSSRVHRVCGRQYPSVGLLLGRKLVWRMLNAVS